MQEQISQFEKVLQAGRRVIIIPQNHRDPDQLASCFALAGLLRKMEKSPSIFLPQEKFSPRLQFLQKDFDLLENFSGLRDFLVIFNTQKNKIISVREEKTADQTVIRITPERETIDPRDFSFVPASYKYDLIITLGIARLEDLEETYFSNSDLFFELPKINFSVTAGTENFALANFLNLSFSTLGELISTVILEKYEPLLDEKIAQALLTAIIGGTDSFKNIKATPSAMVMAARLMKYQADQATIIRHLYKTRSLSFLKLYGKIISRIQHDPETKLIWSSALQEDFIQAGATENDLPFILEEIQNSYDSAEIFAIFHFNSKGELSLKIKTLQPKRLESFCEKYEIDCRPEITLNLLSQSIEGAAENFRNLLKKKANQ